MPITRDNIGYEAMNGLGDSTFLTDPWTSAPDLTNSFDSWMSAISSPIVTPPIALTNAAGYASAISPPNAPGFNWDALLGSVIGAGAKTGLQIASNVTNPAYNTPGAYTRLADGTIIATAGNPVANPSLLASGAFSSMGGMLPLLLIGGVVLLVMVGGKK